MKLPFISRKEHEKILSERDSLEYQNKTLEQEIETALRFNKEVIPRLVRIKVQRNLDYQTYRICVEFQRDMVERGFTHGSDDYMIRHLAERISRGIEEKMISYNFARCDL